MTQPIQGYAIQFTAAGVVSEADADETVVETEEKE